MSKRLWHWLVAITGGLFLAGLPISANAQANGIFADFTTSMGNFTCQLDYTNAPKAVANFIGLATGQRAWLDVSQGRARTNAFYNGLTFHRVIAGFMIQGGSVDGSGGDSPGYAFLDECKPTLTFNAFGKLAMANSGTNSNGAQFFITVADTSWLNNVHTIFGKVTSGSNVVYAISRVGTDANDKPLTNVVIQQVDIRRVGTAAQGFNIYLQGLPIATNLPLSIARAQNQVSLFFSNRLYADNHIFSASTVGGAWTDNPLGIEITPPPLTPVQTDTQAQQQYFRLSQVQYAHDTLAPQTVVNRTLTQVFNSGYFGTNRVVFDSSGSGTFFFARTNGNASGPLSWYSWEQEPYRAVVWLTLTNFPTMRVKHDFTSLTNGRFSGNAYPFYPYGFGAFPVGGSFTLMGP